MDWGEDLSDYVHLLKYKNLPALLNDMSSHVRIVGQKIFAINTQNTEHCFDLIDRTPYSFFFKV